MGKNSAGENFGTPKFWCLVYSCGNHSPWGFFFGDNSNSCAMKWMSTLVVLGTADTFYMCQSV